jgi:hypothetical protein
VTCDRSVVSQGTLVSSTSKTDRHDITEIFSTNKTDRHDITKILLKVALSTINQFTKKLYLIYYSCQVTFKILANWCKTQEILYYTYLVYVPIPIQLFAFLVADMFWTIHLFLPPLNTTISPSPLLYFSGLANKYLVYAVA